MGLRCRWPSTPSPRLVWWGCTWPSQSRSTNAWRKGDGFRVGSWNLGKHYRWLCLVAVVEIGVITVIAILPTSPGGVPWNPDFAWKYVNYTPLAVGGTLLALWLAWELGVKRTYTGPHRTVDLGRRRLLGR